MKGAEGTRSTYIARLSGSKRLAILLRMPVVYHLPSE